MSDVLHIHAESDEDESWWVEELAEPFIPLHLRHIQQPEREEGELEEEIEAVEEVETEDLETVEEVEAGGLINYQITVSNPVPAQRPRKVRPQVYRVISATVHKTYDAAIKLCDGLACSVCGTVSPDKKHHSRHLQGHFFSWVCGCSRQQIFPSWEEFELHIADCPPLGYLVSPDRLASFCSLDWS